MSFSWHGDAIKRKLRSAQKTGVNKTMSESALFAKRHHNWINRTGTLEGSISIADYAHEIRGGVAGTWGSRDVKYAIVQELGSEKMNIPARPYLRPAADATYGKLAKNIRKAFQ